MMGAYRKPKLSRYIKLNPSNIGLLLQEAKQKYRKLTVYWTKCWYLFLPLSLFTTTYACFAFLNCRVFSVFWENFSTEFLKIWNVTSDYLCRKYFRFLVWTWLDITTCKKKTVFTITSIYVISCLQLWKV